MIKIKKNSTQYQENVRKQQFLNKHGIKIKIDGSWGPWQEQQYKKLQQPKNNSFVNTILGSMVAADPAVAYASGWTLTNGNWTQKRTPASNQLANNLSELSWISPTHPGTFVIGTMANKAIKYGKNVYNRYKLANTKLAPISEVKEVLQKYLPDIKHVKGNKYFTEHETGTIFKNADGSNIQTGGVMARPGNTTELHFNPTITYDPNTYEILLTTPRSSSKLVGMHIIKNLPSGTVISSSKNARSIPQIIQKQPLKNRVRYYVTGQTPKFATEVIDGYSTDIIELLAKASNKGNGIITPSLTTKMKGTNIFGKSYNKYSKYFPLGADDYVEFSEMTPKQLNAWNTEVAPITGVYIDPKTRLTDHLIYITK